MEIIIFFAAMYVIGAFVGFLCGNSKTKDIGNIIVWVGKRLGYLIAIIFLLMFLGAGNWFS